MTTRYEQLCLERNRINATARQYQILDHEVDQLRDRIRNDDPHYADAGVTAAILRLAVEHRNACTTSFCLTCTQIKHTLTVVLAASRALVADEEEQMLIPVGQRRGRLLRWPVAD